MYGHAYIKSMNKPGKVASPASGQLNTKMNISPSALLGTDFIDILSLVLLAGFNGIISFVLFTGFIEFMWAILLILYR